MRESAEDLFEKSLGWWFGLYAVIGRRRAA